ncbi:MAG TPA: GNAT family N-acetyltransferase, partial [Bryobacteraceae bacterium]|nr:GNAT family N-acetyltransferase [Bryobacteraceae bacterium]
MAAGYALSTEIDPILVRPAGERDFPAITRIQQRVPEAAQWPLGDFSGSSLLIASRGSEAAGFCAWRQNLSDEAELLNLAVSPDFRRQGVASKLLAALARAAKGSIFLEVAETNAAALELYRKSGWEPCGIRKGYY